jgi:hypothetical protein
MSRFLRLLYVQTIRPCLISQDLVGRVTRWSVYYVICLHRVSVLVVSPLQARTAVANCYPFILSTLLFSLLIMHPFSRLPFWIMRLCVADLSFRLSVSMLKCSSRPRNRWFWPCSPYFATRQAQLKCS